MRRVVGAILSFAASAAVGACVATPQTSTPSPTAPLAVTDLKSLVGMWEGLGQVPSSGSVLAGHTADWVELTIKRTARTRRAATVRSACSVARGGSR
jgi:hypothetical protein